MSRERVLVSASSGHHAIRCAMRSARSAEGLSDAVNSLTFGVHELELDEDHELYGELAKARAVMEHIAWLLGTNAIREGRSLR